MKTLQQIQTEAREVTALGEQFRTAQTAGGLAPAIVAESPVLARFPMAPAPSAGDAASGLLAPPNERYVDAVLERDELLYRLVERELSPGADLAAAASGSLAVISVSSTAFGALLAGYELAEEERLADQLAPYSEGNDDRERGETVAVLETILESGLLPLPDRLRTKADIGAFLDGELEGAELISRTIARQCARESLCESLNVHQSLRVTISES